MGSPGWAGAVQSRPVANLRPPPQRRAFFSVARRKRSGCPGGHLSLGGTLFRPARRNAGLSRLGKQFPENKRDEVHGVVVENAHFP